MKLLILDLDGTIRETVGNGGTKLNRPPNMPSEVRLLPNVKRRLLDARSRGVDITFASNQMGVGTRWAALNWIDAADGDFLDWCRDKRDNYPTAAWAERIAEYTFELIFGRGHGIEGYMAFYYPPKRAGGPERPTPFSTSPIPPHPAWTAEWRKPAPGMLFAALADYECEPEDALFVGDHITDKQAAVAAEIPFRWAAEFFRRRTNNVQVQTDNHRRRR